MKQPKHEFITPLWINAEGTHREYELRITWTPLSDPSTAGTIAAKVRINAIRFRVRKYDLRPDAHRPWRLMTVEMEELCYLTSENPLLVDRLLRSLIHPEEREVESE